MLGNVFEAIEPENVQGRIMLMPWGGGVWAIAAFDRDEESVLYCALLTGLGKSGPAFSIVPCDNRTLLSVEALRPDCVTVTPDFETMQHSEPADVPFGTLGIYQGEYCIWVGGGEWVGRWLRLSDGRMLGAGRTLTVPVFTAWKMEVKAQGWSGAQTILNITPATE